MPILNSVRGNIGITGFNSGSIVEGALVLIKTSTVTSSASLSVSNCFSADYIQYKIIFDLKGVTSGNNVNIRLNTSGDTVDSTTNYNRQRLDAAVDISPPVATRAATSTFWEAFTNTGLNVPQCTEAEIFYPFGTSYTTAYTRSMAVSTGNIEYISSAFSNNVTTSYTGFTALASSNTFTGTISVYGYKTVI
jgi:hypothetical protein